MKVIKVAAVGVAGLLLLAVLVLFFGIPASPLLGHAADAAARAGYQLRVGGPSKISLWPSLNVSADDVSLAEAGQPPVLNARRVRASLSLTGLLTGDIRIGDLVVTEPVIRLTSGQAAQPTAGREGAGAARAIAVDRLTVENGTLIVRDVRQNLEGRIDAIQVTGAFPATGLLDLTAEGKAGSQVLRISAKANSFAQIADGKPTPVDARVELPGLLKTPLAVTANVKTVNQVVGIDGIRGTMGEGRLTGSVSIDASGARPRVTANLVADRVELASVETAAAARSEPWSDRPVDFAVMRVFDANVNLSARELLVRNIRLASAEVVGQLTGGLMSVQLSRAELYGGPVQGRVVVDAASPSPRYGAAFDLSRVDALAFLTDAVAFNHLEGRLQAKLDVTAAGASPAAIVASLGGTAQMSLEDGAVRDVNLPGMVRALSNQTLQGWQEKGHDTTQFTALAATFRVASGQATTDDLRLAGPLVRMTGKGTANLVNQTLDFRVDPKVVMSLQGQGGPTDPAGLGVPVVVRGTWSDPQIYPDVAGILDNPEAAFARLKTMGGALFGLLDQQNPGGRKKVDDVIKSLDQMLRGDGGGQPPGNRKNQVRDVIRDLLGR